MESDLVKSFQVEKWKPNPNHDQYLPRIKVHPNQRFLMTETGQPFFWLGDTAWWIRNIPPVDVENYLSHRARHGFNLIQVHSGYLVTDYLGNRAFEDDNPLRPDESYWCTMDQIIEKAYKHNLYVAFVPMWGDEYGKAFGDDLVGAESFGNWIGNRYASCSHVIWIVSGEYDSINGFRLPVPSRQISLFNAVANGLRSAHHEQQLMTIHPGVARSSSLDFHHAEWLDFNMLQSAHMNDCSQFQLPENHELIAEDYVRRPTKPVLDGEPFYEDTPDGVWVYKTVDHPRCDDSAVRRKAYWSVFSGAFGHTYGHNDIYGYNQPEFPGQVKVLPQGPGQRGDWRLSLDAPGALQMKYLRTLIESHSFFDRVPDDSLIVGHPGNGLERMKATRAARGEWAMIYLPFGQKVLVDLNRLADGKVKVGWFNPRNGELLEEDLILTRQVQSFTPQVEGVDWVLLLDVVE